MLKLPNQVRCFLRRKSTMSGRRDAFVSIEGAGWFYHVLPLVQTGKHVALPGLVHPVAAATFRWGLTQKGWCWVDPWYTKYQKDLIRSYKIHFIAMAFLISRFIAQGHPMDTSQKSGWVFRACLIAIFETCREITVMKPRIASLGFLPVLFWPSASPWKTSVLKWHGSCRKVLWHNLDFQHFCFTENVIKKGLETVLVFLSFFSANVCFATAELYSEVSNMHQKRRRFRCFFFSNVCFAWAKCKFGHDFDIE